MNNCGEYRYLSKHNRAILFLTLVRHHAFQRNKRVSHPAFQITELQTELAEIKSIRDHLNKYIRELEQQNDDLERGKRWNLSSIVEDSGSLK